MSCIYILLCSCGLGISSYRLCQFSEHLELDILGALERFLSAGALKENYIFCMGMSVLFTEPLMVGMITLAPSVTFSIGGLGFLIALFCDLAC